MSSQKMYCVKCRCKQACSNVKEEMDSRKKPRLHGVCKKCGCHCYRYIKPSVPKKSKAKAVSKSKSKSKAKAVSKSKSKSKVKSVSKSKGKSKAKAVL